jgi:hypothetical protein
MNREDIIRMAQEAWLIGLEENGLLENFERFAALVAAAEREACAKVCDLEFAACWHADAISQAKEAKRCADAIRARGNT